MKKVMSLLLVGGLLSVPLKNGWCEPVESIPGAEIKHTSKGFWSTKSKAKLGWGWGLLTGGAAAYAYGMSDKQVTTTESCGIGCTVQMTMPEQRSSGLATAGLGAGLLGITFLISQAVNKPKVASAKGDLIVLPDLMASNQGAVPGVSVMLAFGGEGLED